VRGGGRAVKPLRLEEVALRIEVLEEELAKPHAPGRPDWLKRLIGLSAAEKKELTREMIVAELEALRKAVRRVEEKAAGGPRDL
jgi:hypothetical protein